jgi:hypothetical protein
VDENISQFLQQVGSNDKWKQKGLTCDSSFNAISLDLYKSEVFPTPHSPRIMKLVGEGGRSFAELVIALVKCVMASVLSAKYSGAAGCWGENGLR